MCLNNFSYLKDFLLGLSILSRGSIDEKLRWIFNLYDLNHDGKITKDELEQIITSVYELMGKFTDPPIFENTCKLHVDYVFKVCLTHFLLSRLFRLNFNCFFIEIL